MFNPVGSIRFGVTAAVLLGAFILLHSVSHGEPVVPHQPLRDLSYTVGTWSGQERPLSERIVQAVSVSDYTNRFYFANGIAPVHLYVGDYRLPKPQAQIHSPKTL